MAITVLQPYRFADAGATPVGFGAVETPISNSDIIASTTGTFTTANTTDWVYVALFWREASGANFTWTVTVSDVGGANPQAVTAVATVPTPAQFFPGIWLGKFKPDATGTRQLNISKSAGNWAAVVAVCLRVTGAHTTTPDGNSEVINQATSVNGTTMTDDIAANAGSLVLLAVSVNRGTGGPFSPTNAVTERVDAISGTASNDISAFMGTKPAGAGGTITVGADWAGFQDWASIAHEVRPA